MTKKTAIQELFSKLEIEHPNLFNTNTLEGRQFVNDYYPFLEMEKEQIIKAHGDKKKTKSINNSIVTYTYTYTGEMYFNDNYY